MKDSGCKDCGDCNKTIITKQGERGVQGSPGVPGPRGANGIDGQKGDKGAVGDGPSTLSFELFIDLTGDPVATLPVLSKVTKTGVFAATTPTFAWNGSPANLAAWQINSHLLVDIGNFGTATNYKITEIKVIDVNSTVAGDATWGSNISQMFEQIIRTSLNKAAGGAAANLITWGIYDATGLIGGVQNSDWAVELDDYRIQMTIVAD